MGWRWVSAGAAVLAAVSMLLSVVLFSQLAEADRHFCDVRQAQRDALEQQWENTQAYVRSPGGMERTALNDFIRDISVPQLRERLRTETVPESCS